MEMITFYFYFRKTFTIPLSTLYKAAALYNMLQTLVIVSAQLILLCRFSEHSENIGIAR